MKKENQLILAVAALVVVAAVASVVTWLIVRDDGGNKSSKAATSAARLRERARGPGGGAGEPPPDAKTIAEDKKTNRGDKPRAGDQVSAVGAPNPQPAAQCDANGPPTAFAEWRFTPDSLEKTKGKAKDVVLGDVMSVEAGPDLVIQVPQEPGGEIRTPTTVAKLQVTQSYKGGAKKGDVVSVTQVGNSCVRMANDPMYRRGETALVMLEDGPSGTMQIVAPEGRYQQGPDGGLNPVVDDPATAKLKGKKAGDIGKVLGSG